VGPGVVDEGLVHHQDAAYRPLQAPCDVQIVLAAIAAAIADFGKSRQPSVIVQYRMHLDGPFVRAVLGPTKKTQTHHDSGYPIDPPLELVAKHHPALQTKSLPLLKRDVYSPVTAPSCGAHPGNCYWTMIVRAQYRHTSDCNRKPLLISRTEPTLARRSKTIQIRGGQEPKPLECLSVSCFLMNLAYYGRPRRLVFWENSCTFNSDMVY
jgi:hypothetical protein